MTPVPLDLPLRPDEAAEVAALLFEHAERKPLTDEVRSRLAARSAALALPGLTPHFGSLARDPVHPSTYYLVVDGVEGAGLLMHVAPASAPSSSVFHNALLIGRTKRMNGPEFVVNAIPFGSTDAGSIDRFVTHVDSAFLPRPQGARSTLTIRGEYPLAFDFFRKAHKRRGRNLAAVAGDYHACVWSAIRAGWRQEYSVAAEIPVDRTSEDARRTLAYTRFAVDVSGLAWEQALKAAEFEHEEIRQARALLKSGSGFEFELELGNVSAMELNEALRHLKERGHAPQMVRIGMKAVEEVAPAVLQQRAMPSFRYAGEARDVVEAVLRATGGRFNCWVDTAAQAEFVLENLGG